MQIFFFSPPENVRSKKLRNVFKKTIIELLTLNVHVAHCVNPHLAINVFFVSDEEIRALNAQWRNKESVTDVLSFPYFAASVETQNLASLQNTQDNIFGEIFFGVGRCAEQAVSQGHDSQTEYSILLIHGLLHLFGYDHERDDDFVIMDALEKKIRAIAIKRIVNS